MKPYKLEFCCENVAQAVEASAFVDQIEFCAALDLDGLTPDFNDVKAIQNQTNVLLKIMIRNRAGNFLYNEEDFQTMLSQADEFKKIGIQHFVFGAIGSNGRLDIGLIRRFATHVYPALVCIHKAIDLSTDILADISQLMEIENINEVLTSGGCAKALEGKNMLKKMIELTQDRIVIIAAGKITFQNIEAMHNLIHARMYHGKAIIEI